MKLHLLLCTGALALPLVTLLLMACAGGERETVPAPAVPAPAAIIAAPADSGGAGEALVDSALAATFVRHVCSSDDRRTELERALAAHGHAPLPAANARELDEARDAALLVELRRALNALPDDGANEFHGLPIQLLSAIRLATDSGALAVVAARRAIAREDAPRAESVLLLARVAPAAPGTGRSWRVTPEHAHREPGPEDDFESFTLDAALRLADGRLALLVAGHDLRLLARGADGRWLAVWTAALPDDCGG